MLWSVEHYEFSQYSYSSSNDIFSFLLIEFDKAIWTETIFAMKRNCVINCVQIIGLEQQVLISEQIY